MFLGEYNHSIDAKSRMAMPAKFRNQLKGGAIVTRGLDHCLFVFQKKEWQKLSSKIMELPLTQATSRAFTRLMLSGAAEVDFDKQGRVLIPDYLKSYSGLKKETVVIGLGSRLEIWDNSTWQKYKYRTEKNSEHIAEQLNELGI